MVGSCAKVYPPRTPGTKTPLVRIILSEMSTELFGSPIGPELRVRICLCVLQDRV